MFFHNYKLNVIKKIHAIFSNYLVRFGSLVIVCATKSETHEHKKINKIFQVMICSFSNCSDKNILINNFY